MTKNAGLGNFINGSFINEGTITLTSHDPSCDYEPVVSVKTDPCHIALAIEAARASYQSWTYLTNEQRIKALFRLKDAFQKNEEAFARAISLEMGKVHSEATIEAKSLSARIDLIINYGCKRVQTEPLYDLRAETRYHNQGVLVVIGPYNFPAHLVNSHVIPSILLGNTVIIKPSEVCPLVAHIYAQCVMESELPKGVINIVHGDGSIGKTLSEHADIDGVLFTGSYRTGRLLSQALLDQPHKILALEMGGKNFSVVMDDADLKQALLEIIQAAFLTTGQRCTATSRVLVHDRVFEKFRGMLIKAVRQLRPTMPSDNGLFGPMATKGALSNFLNGLAKAKEEGVEVLVESEVMPKGAFVTPSLYQVSKDHPLKHYLAEELFGPNIALENFSHLDDAIARMNQSPYGLSNSIFTFDDHNSERMIEETKSGVLNINRSTNNAYGQMPFGGVNKSGNQRPAGIDAVRNATFPMAITSIAYGESSAHKVLTSSLQDVLAENPPLFVITLRHDFEAIFELYGIYVDRAANTRMSLSHASFDGLGIHTDAFFRDLALLFGAAIELHREHFIIDLSKIADSDLIKQSLRACLQRYVILCGLSFKKIKSPTINVPQGLAIPRSRNMLDRLYKGQFIPAEKKALVVDLKRSKGPYLVSVDDNPLTLFDAGSQIATLGAGFFADTFQNAYDNHDFDRALLRNCDLSLDGQNENCATFQDAEKARRDFENFLHEKTEGQFNCIAYGASGAEANEIAFDLARLHGPGGTRILAFEGSFHGRTIMALQATFNKEKRGPFAFAGYEATFLPFPETKNPRIKPEIPPCFLESLSRGHIPQAPPNDDLFAQEIASLACLKDEMQKGNICAVIIEPMQCEGGDKYATDRFFSGLRALTRALKVPLIFDEVQTGFHLGRRFFWHQQINLIDHRGMRDIPDCVTMAKKAQLGVCMSVWSSSRLYAPPHVIQLKRGLLHAKVLDQTKSEVFEEKALKELQRLKDYFPELVLHPRASGFAFAFDMPSKEHATELVDQRFHRGFMAYIAGEKTLRFRLNIACSDEIIHRLFEALFVALVDMRDGNLVTRIKKHTPQDAPKPHNEIAIMELTPELFERNKNAIAAIEVATYEEGRRDSMDALLSWLTIKDGLGLLITCTINGSPVVAGYAFGGPLEHTKVDGAIDDGMRGHNNTFYSANITILEHVRGLGLGNLLKNEQIKRIAIMNKPDGTPRYSFMSGRNRMGQTKAMTQINDNLGAYVVSTHDNQYNEKGAKAIYYRLPLELGNHSINMPKPTSLDCHNSIERAFKLPPASLVAALQNNQLRAIAGSKLTLSNWATPHIVRYSELLRALMPRHLNHVYFTSGRDEIIDKGLRCLRFHRQEADIAIGFSHQWLGHNTAAARSLSHDENLLQPFSFFNWPKIAHPGLVGTQASLKELKAYLSNVSADKILGIVVELLGERSGLSFSDEFLNELDALRKATNIPLIFVENASSLYRTGRSLFLSDALSVKANMVLWYAGGQLGHVMVDDHYFVEKPLTLISTWDGDEISMARAYHHLSAVSMHDQKRTLSFEKTLKTISTAIDIHGMGLWHGVRLGTEARLKQARTRARDTGIFFGAGYDSSLMICPKLDFTDDDFAKIIDVLKDILSTSSSSK